jgi:hypothetical protein
LYPFSGSLPEQIVTPSVDANGDATYTGLPLPVDLTFNFAHPSAFLGNSSVMRSLMEFGFTTRAPDFPRAIQTDFTSFRGNMRLTYVYGATKIPEPASVLTLGVGLLALIGLRFAVSRNPRAS